MMPTDSIIEKISEFFPEVSPYLKKLQLFINNLYDAIPPLPYKETIFSVLIAVILIIFLLGCFFLFHRLFIAPFTESANKRAGRLFAKGKFEKAKRYFIKARNYKKAAQCCVKLGQYLAAAENFEKSKDFDMSAKYYAQEGESLKAAELYHKVKRPLEAAEQFEHAGDCMQAGLLYQSIKYLKKAEEMYNKEQSYLHNAQMFETEFLQESQKSQDKIDEKTLGKRHAFLKGVSKKSGDYYTMVPDYEKAAAIYLQGGNREEGAEALEAAGQYAEAAGIFLKCDQRQKAAACFEKAGDFDDAIATYKSLEDHEAVALAMEKAGKTKAAAEYRAHIDLKKGEKIRAADSFRKAGRLQEAANLFRDIDKHEEAAALFEQIGQLADAGTAYQNANRLEDAARCYAQANRFSSAAKCYLELNQEAEYLAMLAKGSSFLEAGMYLLDKDDDKAITFLQQIDPDSPDYRYACNLLGRIFLKRDMESLASEKLEKAVEDLSVEKNTLDFFYDLAELRQKQNQLEEAAKIYDQVLAVDYHYKDALAKRQALEKPSIEQKTAESAKVIKQRYKIDREVGRGGMGVVYKAADSMLQRTVALKFLPPALTARQEDNEKFLKEARSAARLNHTNIVTIYDIEVDPESQNYFIVMEFVDGVNLKEIIDSSCNLPFNVIAMICNQICQGLAYAHQKNIVHRDIKSANILWTNDKIVKITDFGLAKIVEESMSGSTRSQGSPIYMAPEQILGQTIDHRTDIYALGISLYEMVAGRPPFDRGDIGYHHLHTLATPLANIRQDTPEYLTEIVERCIQKKPEDRYQSVTEIRTRLESSQKATG